MLLWVVAAASVAQPADPESQANPTPQAVSILDRAAEPVQAADVLDKAVAKMVQGAERFLGEPTSERDMVQHVLDDLKSLQAASQKLLAQTRQADAQHQQRIEALERAVDEARTAAAADLGREQTAEQQRLAAEAQARATAKPEPLKFQDATAILAAEAAEQKEKDASLSLARCVDHTQLLQSQLDAATRAPVRGTVVCTSALAGAKEDLDKSRQENEELHRTVASMLAAHESQEEPAPTAPPPPELDVASMGDESAMRVYSSEAEAQKASQDASSPAPGLAALAVKSAPAAPTAAPAPEPRLVGFDSRLDTVADEAAAGKGLIGAWLTGKRDAAWLMTQPGHHAAGARPETAEQREAKLLATEKGVVKQRRLRTYLRLPTAPEHAPPHAPPPVAFQVKNWARPSKLTKLEDDADDAVKSLAA